MKTENGKLERKMIFCTTLFLLDDIEDEMTSDEIDESLEWLRSIYNEDKVTMKDNALLLLINNKTLLVNHLKDAQLEHQ